MTFASNNEIQLRCALHITHNESVWIRSKYCALRHLMQIYTIHRFWHTVLLFASGRRNVFVAFKMASRKAPQTPGKLWFEANTSKVVECHTIDISFQNLNLLFSISSKFALEKVIHRMAISLNSDNFASHSISTSLTVLRPFNAEISAR